MKGFMIYEHRFHIPCPECRRDCFIKAEIHEDWIVKCNEVQHVCHGCGTDFNFEFIMKIIRGPLLTSTEIRCVPAKISE